VSPIIIITLVSVVVSFVISRLEGAQFSTGKFELCYMQRTIVLRRTRQAI
jgi:hypothetical protein